MNNNETFSKVVKKFGFTEPNPLACVDVARKMLIITRLLGFKYEINDIQNDV